MKSCPFCAEPDIQDAAIVCKHCGRDLSPAPPERAVNKDAITLRGAVTVIVLGAILAIIVAFALTPQGSLPASSSPATDDDVRAQLLLRAITGVGESCDEVTRVFHQGGNAARGDFWNATCRNGRSYSVRQQSTGEVQVLSCEMLKVVAKVDCFVPF